MTLEFWRVADDGAVTGPFAAEQLQAALASGLVTPRARVWRQGLPGWAPIGEHFTLPGGAVGDRRSPASRPGELVLLLLSTLAVWLGAGLVGGLLVFHLSEWLAPEDLTAGWAASGALLLLATTVTAPLWWRQGRRLSRRAPELGALVLAAVLVLSFATVSASFVVLAATPGIARTAAAIAEFRYSLRFDRSQRTVYLVGNVGPRLWLSLRPYFGENGPARRLVITSSGGLVGEALRVARMIEARGDVTTIARGQCDSACTIVLMSGKSRLADFDMRIGFHAAAPVTDSSNPLVVDLVSQEGDASDRYLERRGVPAAIVTRARRLGPRQLVYVSATRLAELGVLTGLLDGDMPVTPAEAKVRLAAAD